MIENQDGAGGISSNESALRRNIMKDIAGKGLRATKSHRTSREVSDMWDFERVKNMCVITETP
jgi:hypothetical protein